MSSEDPVTDTSPNTNKPGNGVELTRNPTIVFDSGPDQLEIEEKPRPTAIRSGNKNLEMRREVTQEDKELSRANYDHLEREKSHDGDGNTVNQADIREHRHTAERLLKILDTDFDIKAPASSFGLTSEEAAARLARNGPNVLTPPKKKSAFQKASEKKSNPCLTSSFHNICLQFIDCLRTLFNVLLIFAGILEYILLGVDFKVRENESLLELDASDNLLFIPE